MGSPVQSYDLSTSLVLAGLNSPNKMGLVYSQDYGYNVITQLSSKLAPSISTSVARVDVPAMGNTSVFSPITSTGTLNADGTLLVNLQNALNFRVGDVCADTNLVQGRVISVTPLTVTLKPISVTFVAATHFATGTAKVLFDASVNRESVGKSTLTYTPTYDYALTAVTRESTSQARRDRVATYPMWKGGFWYRAQDEIALKQFSKSLEYKYYFSERAITYDQNGKEIYTTGGVRWSILNNGGEYMPLSSAMTLSTLNTFLKNMARKNGSNKLVALAGIEAIASLQTLLADYIKNAGTANTFGGAAVMGLNVFKYAYAGIELELVHYKLFDDEMFRNEISTVTGAPKMSSSILVIDPQMIPAADGSGSLSPLQKYHFNNDELLAGYTPGMIGTQNSDPSSIRQAIAAGYPAASLATSDVDSVGLHILSDCGLWCQADRFGLIEMTV